MPAGLEADAVAFHQGAFGIPQVPNQAHLAARGVCWFEREGLRVRLGADVNFRPATKAHPAIGVDDVPSMATALSAAGITVIVDEPLDGRSPLRV